MILDNSLRVTAAWLLVVVACGCTYVQSQSNNPSSGAAIPPTTALGGSSPKESLTQAWAEAVAGAQRLKASHGKSEAARERVSEARAFRYPAVKAQGGRFWLDEAPSAVVSLPGAPGLPVVLDDSFWAGQVSLSLPLFTSGRIRHAVGAAKAALKSTQAAESRDILDLKMDVADVYLSVLRAIRAVDLADSNVASLTSHSANVTTFFEKGLVARKELLAAEVVLSDALQHQIRARNRLDLSRASYSRLLVRPLTHVPSLEDLQPPQERGDVNVLTAHAFRERPEIVMRTEQVEALRRQAKSVRAGALPAVGVSASYLHLENSYLQRDHVWMLGLAGSWNIFDGGITRHRARSLEADADAAAAMHQETLSIVALQVRHAWLDLDETLRRLTVTRIAVAQALENFNVARDRYRTGIGTSIDVLDAESLRVLSIGNHDNAILDSVMAGLRLRRSVGDL